MALLGNTGGNVPNLLRDLTDCYRNNDVASFDRIVQEVLARGLGEPRPYPYWMLTLCRGGFHKEAYDFLASLSDEEAQYQL